MLLSIDEYFSHTAPYKVEDKPTNNPFSIEFPLDPDKMIGNLTADIRYTKVLKYLIKKRKRCNAKKVLYKCRQKVADQRIRVHGRFITKANANMLLEQISAGHDAIPSEINKHLRITGMENLVNSGRKRRKHNIQTH
jgi:hypothetical protein